MKAKPKRKPARTCGELLEKLKPFEGKGVLTPEGRRAIRRGHSAFDGLADLAGTVDLDFEAKDHKQVYRTRRSP